MKENKSGKNINISVVVPAHNEEALLSLCLESLKSQDFHGAFEVIVVDNHSTDKTSEIAKKYPVKLIYESKKGIAFARQKGFQIARGKIIASTDADTIVPENWLTRIVRIFRENPQAVAVTGNIDFYGRTKRRLAIFNIISPLARLSTWILSGRQHLWGANLAIRRDVFKKIGGFDSRLVAGEDYDLGSHAKEFGKIIYQRDLTVNTSARRFENKVKAKNILGLIDTYVINFFWLLFFKKPRVSKFDDIRTNSNPTILSPKLIKNMRIFASVTVLIIFSIIVLFYGFFSPRSQVYGKNYWHSKTKDKIIALTFDDGPNEPYTSQILDILAKYQIKATFFTVGENVRYYPEVTKKIIKQGNIIANHSYSHQDNLAIADQKIMEKEIDWAQEEIYQTSGLKPHLFRPPHGYKSPWLMETIKKDNLIAVGWSDMTNDWNQPGLDKIVKNIIKKARPGGIIVLHDGNRTLHGSDRSQEVAALPKIIEDLQSKGYKFVTVSDLLKVSPYNN